MPEVKRSWIAYLLWCFCLFGICGAHRFYIGEIGWGVIYLITFGFCGIGQFIDLFTIPGMVRKRNLVDRSLSEDLKNDAIRNATMVISGISAVNKHTNIETMQNDTQKIILDLLESGQSLSIGRLTAFADLPYSVIKKEIDNLVNNNVLSSSVDESGTKTYFLP